MAVIYCVPLDGFPEVILWEISTNLERRLGITTTNLPEMKLQSHSFDPERGQNNSTAILQGLQIVDHEQDDRVLGLTMVDLFIPIFTFVFGEAQLNGLASVVSGFRLRNEYYGLPRDSGLFHERLLKECLHELGHTWGLHHCLNSSCVMRKSTYVENIDLKEADFCPECVEERKEAPNP
ncbi:archaemetzincin family Zn-dependent metalloprotease [candidate division KSB1 bacterium]